MAAGGDLTRIACAGDSALIVEFPARIDPSINDRANALARTLQQRWGAVLRDLVVGYCTVTVYFDPRHVDAPWLESEIRSAAGDAGEAAGTAGNLVEVPVCYEAELAPDLDDVAALGGCTREEAIALHTAATYRVYMVGFIPGFAYMAEVDPRIRAPRREVPRTSVAPGSVAIAGGQTGVYPAATPGGWNIIGRTPLKPYDVHRAEPLLFRTGDRVRFVAISRAEFDRAS
jgi:inhibitor of KinA